MSGMLRRLMSIVMIMVVDVVKRVDNILHSSQQLSLESLEILQCVYYAIDFSVFALLNVLINHFSFAGSKARGIVFITHYSITKSPPSVNSLCILNSSN